MNSPKNQSGSPLGILVEAEDFDDYGGWVLDFSIRDDDGVALSSCPWPRSTRW